jgi:hypothetical protein
VDRVRALTVFDGTATGFVRGKPPCASESAEVVHGRRAAGDGNLLETPSGKSFLSTAATMCSLPATSPSVFATVSLL